MNEENLNKALGAIKAARFWMQAEKNRDPVPLRAEDWEFLISCLVAAEELIDPPKQKN